MQANKSGCCAAAEWRWYQLQGSSFLKKCYNWICLDQDGTSCVNFMVSFSSEGFLNPEALEIRPEGLEHALSPMSSLSWVSTDQKWFWNFLPTTTDLNLQLQFINGKKSQDDHFQDWGGSGASTHQGSSHRKWQHQGGSPGPSGFRWTMFQRAGDADITKRARRDQRLRRLTCRHQTGRGQAKVSGLWCKDSNPEPSGQSAS